MDKADIMITMAIVMVDMKMKMMSMIMHQIKIGRSLLKLRKKAKDNN